MPPIIFIILAVVAVVGMIIMIIIIIIITFTTDVIEVGVDGGRTTIRIDLGRGLRRPGRIAVFTMTLTATIIITMIAIMATMTMDTPGTTAVGVAVKVEGGDRAVGRGNGGEDTVRMMTVDTKGARTRSQSSQSHRSLDPERVMVRSSIDRDPRNERGMRMTGGETENQKTPKHWVLVKWKAQWSHRHRERAEGGATIRIGATRIVIETKGIVESTVTAAIALEVEAGVGVVSLLVVRSVVVMVIELPMIERGKKMVRMIIIGHGAAMMKIAKRGGAAITDMTVLVAEVLVARDLVKSR
jgi:hypothetical protein